MTMIKVVCVPADTTIPVTVREVGHDDLPAMQALVGGHIEQVMFTQDTAAIFNEEGMYALPLNIRAYALLASYGYTNGSLGYFGNMFFTGFDGPEFCSVPPAVVQWYAAMGEDL